MGRKGKSRLVLRLELKSGSKGRMSEISSHGNNRRRSGMREDKSLRGKLKIAAIDTHLKEQMLKSINDKLEEKEVKLPPKPSGNPLKPRRDSHREGHD